MYLKICNRTDRAIWYNIVLRLEFNSLHNNITYWFFLTTFDHFCSWFSFRIGHVCGLLITVLKSDGLVSILIVNKTVREYLLVHISPSINHFTQAVRHHTPCYNLLHYWELKVLSLWDRFQSNSIPLTRPIMICWVWHARDL